MKTIQPKRREPDAAEIINRVNEKLDWYFQDLKDLETSRARA